MKDNAYKIIKDKILNLEIKPGSRIWEDQLANEISMSRTPIREAINQLTADGYVNNIPRKGVFCIELTEDEITEILDVREVLEILALKKCIDRASDEQIKSLEELIREFELELEHENYSRCNELDSLFHMQIASITANKKLIKFVCEVENLLHIARSMELQRLPKAKHETALKDHRRMLQCIIDKDKSHAEGLIAEHIRNMKSNLEIG